MLSHKIELDPCNKQITYFKKACGISRLAWNWGVAEWNKQYQNGESPTAFKLKKQFNAIKKEEFPFVYDVTKYACQQPFINLQKTYNEWFKYIKKGKSGRKIGKPTFKKKGQSKDSFYLGETVKVVGKTVKIPNMKKPIRLKEELRFDERILSATISRTADKWFISFTVDKSVISRSNTCKKQTSVGIDLGIKEFATLSNGEVLANPKHFKKALKKTKRLSRQLSRKQHKRSKQDKTVASNNYKKHTLKLARHHAKVANQRKDFLHKFTTYLTKDFKHIAIEDLNASGMMKNRRLSASIADLGLFEFKRQLLYKAELNGNEITVIYRWFPSSKTCSSCGSVKKELKLSERIYKCAECGFVCDRDLNASFNIEDKIPTVSWKSTPVEISALNLEARLSNSTSIVETGSKHLCCHVGSNE